MFFLVYGEHADSEKCTEHAHYLRTWHSIPYQYVSNYGTPKRSSVNQNWADWHRNTLQRVRHSQVGNASHDTSHQQNKSVWMLKRHLPQVFHLTSRKRNCKRRAAQKGRSDLAQVHGINCNFSSNGSVGDLFDDGQVDNLENSSSVDVSDGPVPPLCFFLDSF